MMCFAITKYINVPLLSAYAIAAITQMRVREEKVKKAITSFIPRPSPSFLSLAVQLSDTSSDRKLGEGLRMRLSDYRELCVLRKMRALGC